MCERDPRPDLVETGIIDPTKVVWITLEDAASVAGVLLLTEATLTELPEPKRERRSHPRWSERGASCASAIALTQGGTWPHG